QASATAPAGGVAEQPALFGESAPLEARPLFGRVLGQVQDTFVVSASDDEVFFLDQHVAHERVIFEGLRRELDSGKSASQALLFPELGASETPYFCPHGRPIVSRVSLGDIRRELKRTW